MIHIKMKCLFVLVVKLLKCKYAQGRFSIIGFTIVKKTVQIYLCLLFLQKVFGKIIHCKYHAIAVRYVIHIMD